MGCSGWCVPLYIYLVLAMVQIASILLTKSHIPWKTKVLYLAISISWNILIGSLMYYLCKQCHSGWSWIVLLLPLAINVISMFILIFTSPIGI